MNKEEAIIAARCKLAATMTPIESGWAAFSKLAPLGQEARYRLMFYAGVKYLWFIIAAFLNEEITNEEEANAVKMALDRIERELNTVAGELASAMGMVQ